MNIRERVSELAAYANAAAVSTVEKIHGAAAAEAFFEKVCVDPAALQLLQDAVKRKKGFSFCWARRLAGFPCRDPQWSDRARGECNYQMNNTDMYLFSEFIGTRLEVQLLAVWLARLWLNCDGGVGRARTTYREE
eukprot:4502402-Pyramimonas_sp.AAC.1